MVKLVDPYSFFEIQFEDLNSCSYATSPSEVIIEPIWQLLTKDFHEYVKNINGVEVSVNSKTIDLPGVSYAIHRLLPMQNPNNITLNILNTKYSFIERAFIPWMKYNTIGGNLPLMKTNMSITFPSLAKNDDGSEVVYWYYGIRPIECGLRKMSNEANSEFYRKVTFDFDYFYVDYNSVLVPGGWPAGE